MPARRRLITTNRQNFHLRKERLRKRPVYIDVFFYDVHVSEFGSRAPVLGDVRGNEYGYQKYSSATMKIGEPLNRTFRDVEAIYELDFFFCRWDLAVVRMLELPMW